MADFDSGVSGYVTGTAVVKVGFPVDWHGSPDISCKQCTFYRSTSRRCQLNNEVVAFPERYVGDKCPLEMTNLKGD